MFRLWWFWHQANCVFRDSGPDIIVVHQICFYDNKKLPSLPSSVVSKTCSTLAQCLRQLFERSALSKRPYPTPAVVLGDRQDSIGRETDPSQLSQPAGMPMPMPNRQACPCPIGRPCRMPPPSFSTDGSWALTKETDQDAAKRCHK